MKNFVTEVLEANKHIFKPQAYFVLLELAKQENQYNYRKTFESEVANLPYVPSFSQRLEEKLNSIGLYIDAIPANDGTRRKLYALRKLAAREVNS